MEGQLFDWTGCNAEYFPERVTFFKPVLRVQIGKYLPGTPFEKAVVTYGTATLLLCSSDTVMGEYKLALSVRETVRE